jgi:hypothetical protein
MSRTFRILLFLLCAAQAIFAAGFFLQATFALALWPWRATGPLSAIFIASIFAAAAASTAWCVASQTYGALAGIALDYLVIFTPLALYSFVAGVSSGQSGLTWFGVACVTGVILGAALLRWSRRIPMSPTPPTPRLVRWSFVVFIIALALVGGQMIFHVPNVVPWRVSDDLSVIIGLIFLGAAAYFTYAALFPSWSNAAGQLIGFLAYDLVLIGPFLQRVGTIQSQFRVSLLIYITVLIYSGLLAIYYLFVSPATRIVPLGRRRDPIAVSR